ncbi:hypothetical protein [Streptomyces sp. NPDC048644]|uniref:hypothetical protein n=1 Tax=Streptomyces sp. NPDC048644 TaxID=3365582 RepID=UPI00371AB600
MTTDPNGQGERDDGGRRTAGEPARTGGADRGGIAIGLMTGGAVAAGERARAEDRSDRAPAPAPAAPAPAGATPPPSGIAIGTMTGGAVAAGPEAHALDASRRPVLASPELVRALAELRAELPVAATGSDGHGDGHAIAELTDQLTLVEGGIARTQQAERGRLERLRALLTSGSTLAGGLASAVAVVQAISALLG